MRRTTTLATVILLLITLSDALAHTDRYPSSKWRASHAHTGLHITWRFSPGFPDGGPKKNRVIEAFGRWNSQDQQMDFTRLSDASSSYAFDCDDFLQPYNGVFENPIDGVGDQLAFTLKCVHTDDTMHHFSIKFDEDETWHALAENGPNNEHDYGGVASHETGHATGWGPHFGAQTTECIEGDGIDNHTMCGTVDFAPFGFRSLEVHDKHSFDNEYPDD